MLKLVKNRTKRCQELLIARVIRQDGIRSRKAAPDVGLAGIVDGVRELQQLVSLREEQVNARVALAHPPAEANEVGAVFGEYRFAGDIHRAVWVALVPDEKYLPARLEDALAFLAKSGRIKPVKRLGSAHQVHALIGEGCAAVAAGNRIKAREAAQLALCFGAHVRVGFDGKHPCSEQQKLTRENACAGANIRDTSASANAQLILQISQGFRGVIRTVLLVHAAFSSKFFKVIQF